MRGKEKVVVKCDAKEEEIIDSGYIRQGGGAAPDHGSTARR